ncbi:MAG: ZPR1 zinc finger domain-containing protein [Methanocalculaceae archaeon]|jgi:zinc finger protein|nr:ZPR1 zinc finger domain-containing protein [Methanocalculaceae archaeon]
MYQVVPGLCPDCGREIEYIYDTEYIPYFSDMLLLSGVCPDCGFRITDTMILNDHEPCRWEMKASTPEDLDVRVIRSMQGEVDIPEFGINIYPGPACSGFVSNMEGVLMRAEDAVRRVLLSCEGEEVAAANELLEKIDKARRSEHQFTVIITDPSGNSGIVSPKAVKTKPDEEPQLNDCTMRSLA